MEISKTNFQHLAKNLGTYHLRPNPIQAEFQHIETMAVPHPTLWILLRPSGRNSTKQIFKLPSVSQTLGAEDTESEEKSTAAHQVNTPAQENKSDETKAQ